MVAGTVTLILGCERSAKKASSKLTPTPETDPLAQPKSLQQVGAPVEIAIGILGFVGLYKVFKERRNERIGFTSQSNPTLSFNLVHKSGAGQYFRDYAVDEKCYKNSLCIHPNVTTKTISIF